MKNYEELLGMTKLFVGQSSIEQDYPKLQILAQKNNISSYVLNLLIKSETNALNSQILNNDGIFIKEKEVNEILKDTTSQKAKKVEEEPAIKSTSIESNKIKIIEHEEPSALSELFPLSDNIEENGKDDNIEPVIETDLEEIETESENGLLTKNIGLAEIFAVEKEPLIEEKVIKETESTAEKKSWVKFNSVDFWLAIMICLTIIMIFFIIWKFFL